MLVLLHCLLLGKIATGGVIAKITVLNIAMNYTNGFAALLKKKTVGREGN